MSCASFERIVDNENDAMRDKLAVVEFQGLYLIYFAKETLQK